MYCLIRYQKKKKSMFLLILNNLNINLLNYDDHRPKNDFLD